MKDKPRCNGRREIVTSMLPRNVNAFRGVLMWGSWPFCNATRAAAENQRYRRTPALRQPVDLQLQQPICNQDAMSRDDTLVASTSG